MAKKEFVEIEGNEVVVELYNGVINVVHVPKGTKLTLMDYDLVEEGDDTVVLADGGVVRAVTYDHNGREEVRTDLESTDGLCHPRPERVRVRVMDEDTEEEDGEDTETDEDTEASDGRSPADVVAALQAFKALEEDEASTLAGDTVIVDEHNTDPCEKPDCGDCKSEPDAPVTPAPVVVVEKVEPEGEIARLIRTDEVAAKAVQSIKNAFDLFRQTVNAAKKEFTDESK
jgi:hypothetical protein